MLLSGSENKQRLFLSTLSAVHSAVRTAFLNTIQVNLPFQTANLS
jgi:hypothetical protein